jgi:hypothetical protein
MVYSPAGHRRESGKQSVRLALIEDELNRLDTAVICAVKTGTCLPSSSLIFGTLMDASIAFADIDDAYKDHPRPVHVRNEVSRLHCAVTDLEASLQLYAQLSVAGRGSQFREG